MPAPSPAPLDLTQEALAWWDRMPSAGGLGSEVAAVVIPPRRPRAKVARVRVSVLQHLTYRTLATSSASIGVSPWLRVDKSVPASQLRPRKPGEWNPPQGWDEWLRKETV